MSFLTKIFGEQKAPTELDVSTLMLMPAVMRIGIAGKDFHQELETLTQVAAKSPHLIGMAPEDILAKSRVLANIIHQKGVAAAIGMLQSNLSARQRMDAMQLALVLVIASPLTDANDIGILAGMSEKLGMHSAEFDQLFVHAKVA
ncbi:MAG: hypothetical protein ABJQ34_09885 [Paracoccaceae bacterium]